MVLNGQGKRVFIQEVATRDGFQIEPRMVPTQDKIALIDRLSQCGLSKIEVTSFTSPKAIPTLADAEDVMRGIARVPGVVWIMERAYRGFLPIRPKLARYLVRAR